MAHIKDTYYFPHDSNARSDPKILALRSDYGMEGYGRYWALIEMLREQPGFKLKLSSGYARKAIAKELECDEDAALKFVQDCIKEFELFETDGEYFWSNSLLRRMELKKEKSEKARQAAQQRWGNAGNEKTNASAMHTHSESNASKVKESKDKVKESKGGGSGGNSETEELQPEITESPNNRPEELKNTTTEEREILSVLKSIDLYPFDFAKDMQFIRELAIDYPGIDLLYQAKKWRDYKRDKPLTKRSSPRAQLRNWMNKADEWRDKNNGKTGRNTAGGPARADPAGKYREFVTN